jgi:hypothetical protein
MRFAAALFALALKFGGVGLLAVGILDSSFLFVPWGNDVLVLCRYLHGSFGGKTPVRGPAEACRNQGS